MFSLRKFTFTSGPAPSVAAGLLIVTLASNFLLSDANRAFGQTKSTEANSNDSVEKRFMSGVRQVTFEGRRSGEGYYNADGSLMVFQSERRADNPFFQIYLLDFETGDVESISPGHGMTTCAWVHPDNNLILYSSTQDDPEAKSKQKKEFELRESGKASRYSWPYEDTYEIYSYDRKKKSYNRLTNTLGYDAEGSYSPDGKLIAFASNRNGYTKELSPEEKEKFEFDAAYMMEIYVMNADGSNVRQLTDVPGYDGGPFFSPDGKRICWRRFSENGVTAEIMTMNLDGTDQQRITRIGAMSWAPFYHPSGKYLVFTTNRHGFDNFELYIVAADGANEPVRITDTEGFDGLASFTPDGKQLTWTSNRNAKKESQIYLGNWDHEAVLKALSSSPKVKAAPDSDTPKNSAADKARNDAQDKEEQAAAKTGAQAALDADAKFDPQDIMRHVDYLCRKELGGRMTGSSGERKATAYVAAYMDYLGLKPAGKDGTWYQTFEFPDGAEVGTNNYLAGNIPAGDFTKVSELNVNKDWRPLTFSGNVETPATEVVFAGYGIVAPEKDGQPAYDSYKDLDVKDKWVMAFRFVPEEVSPERRQQLQFYAGLRKKAFFAREQGAKGLIIVSGPSSQVRNQLVPMQNDFSPSGSSMAAISVTDAVAQSWLPKGKSLAVIQKELDSGTEVTGFNLGTGLTVKANVDIKKVVGQGRNVIGRLQAGDEPSAQAIIVGAHIDHLGTGKTGGSLAKDDEKENIHFGADDNASGVAGMLEIAEYLVDLRKKGKLNLKRDVIFAGWSGEELGLHGSANYAKLLTASTGEQKSASFHDFVLSVNSNGQMILNGEITTAKDLEGSLAFIGKSVPDFEVEIQKSDDLPEDKLNELVKMVEKFKIKKIKFTDAKPNTGIVAALNMDMIGRLEDKLVLQGIGSSSYWKSAIESKNAVIGLPLTLSDDTNLPTDATSFYRVGVPILSAFTGSHSDYHTPRDTPDKLNYPDAARIAKLMGLITRSLATGETVPDYIKQKDEIKQTTSRGGRAYLGSVPDYGDDVVGVKLGSVTKGAPADKAGIKGGDIIVKLAGKKIENIYDYTAVIDGLKVGQPTKIVVARNGEEIELEITPGSRQ